MDRSIPGGDLIGRWSLSFADIDFVNSKPALTRLGLAAQLKFFASLGFFAIDPGSIPTDGLSYLAEQLGVEAGEIAGYDFSSRTARRHCAEILIHRSEEHTSELQSLMRISYAVFCLKKKTIQIKKTTQPTE